MEVALQTFERKWAVGKLNHFKPKGGLLFGLRSADIQRKWVEICGDLMSPKKREMFKTVRHYDILTAAWQKKWYDTYWAMSRKDMTRQAAWAVIAASGIDDDLGYDIRGDVLLTTTWMWSDFEKKTFFVTRLDSEDLSLVDDAYYKKEDKDFCSSSHYVDYVADIGLSGGSVDEIDNPDSVVNPRYNHTIDVSKLKDTSTIATIGVR